MSQRFPSLASQSELNAQRRRRHDAGANVLVLTLAQVPSLPWFELILGTAFLMVLRGL